MTKAATTLDVDKAVQAALAKALGKPLADFLKDATAADVHQTTALGNDKKKKKTFLSTLSDAKEDADPEDQTSVGKADMNLPFQIVTKSEGDNADDQRLVFGWASISTNSGTEVIDKQGDIIAPDELEKAAYDFVLYSRTQGDMHVRKGVGRLVESMVFTKQKQELLGIDLGLEGWFVGFKVDDDAVWKSIKAGNLPEFSVGGRGKRVPVE